MEPQKAYQESERNQRVYDDKQAAFDLDNQAKQALINAEALRSQRIWEQKAWNSADITDKL